VDECPAPVMVLLNRSRIGAVGSGGTYKTSLEMVRRGGTVVGFGGSPPGTHSACDPNLIYYRSINFVGSYHYKREPFKQALSLIISGASDLSSIVTTRLPMSRLAEAIDLC